MKTELLTGPDGALTYWWQQGTCSSGSLPLSCERSTGTFRCRPGAVHLSADCRPLGLCNEVSSQGLWVQHPYTTLYLAEEHLQGQEKGVLSNTCTHTHTLSLSLSLSHTHTRQRRTNSPRAWHGMSTTFSISAVMCLSGSFTNWGCSAQSSVKSVMRVLDQADLKHSITLRYRECAGPSESIHLLHCTSLLLQNKIHIFFYKMFTWLSKKLSL